MISIFKSTIQKQFFKYFFLTSILSVVTLGFFSYTFYLRTYIRSEYDHLLSTTNKAKYNIEFLLSIVNNNSILLSSNEDIIKFCTTQFEPGDPKIFDSSLLVNTMLRNTVSLNEHLNGIYIIGNNGMFFTSYWDVTEEKIREWVHIENEETIANLFADNNNNHGIYKPQLERNVISFIKPIYKFPEGKIIGTLIIDINYIYMREIFFHSSLTENDLEKVLIVNSQQETLFTFPFNTNMDFLITDNSELFEHGLHQKTMDIFGKESFVISEPFKQNDWRIIRITFLDYLNKATQTTFLFLIIFLIIIILAYLVISIVLSNSIAKPIIELNEKLKLIQNGNFNVKIESHRRDEIGQLNDTFNRMTGKIDNLLKQSVDEQKRKSDLEFEVLQAQVNPHFLYNTLDSIKWLAVIQGVENISDMITALINLLKYNISHTSLLVPTEEEIKSVKNYIQIQKFRYGEIFSVSYNIPKEIMQMQMLKFLLQPIVENAIFHGLKDREEGGHIVIEAFIENNNCLVFTIIDNGSGFQFDQDGNFIKEKSTEKGLHRGIGISNLQERIHLFSKNNYGLSFSNIKEGGGKVTLRLPVILSEKKE